MITQSSKRSFDCGNIGSQQMLSVCPELNCKMNRKMFGKSNRNLHGHKISSSREEFFIVVNEIISEHLSMSL